MKSKPSIVVGALVFFLVFNSQLFGQSPAVIGAEIQKTYLNLGYTEVSVFLYTRYAPKDSIFLDWGDGFTQEVQANWVEYHPHLGVYEQCFSRYHYYNVEPGYYVLKLVERDIIDSVLNITNSDEKAMIINDTILLPSLDQPFIIENAGTMMPAGAYVFSTGFWGTGGWEDEEGVQLFEQRCNCVNPQVGYLEYSIEPFPAEGAEPLPATNGVHIEPVSYNRSVLVWDKPVAPGRYGFGVKIRQFMRDLENPTDTTLLATTLRAVILDIDSTMTLTPVSMPGIEGFISLYPNPASDHFDLQLGGFRAPVQVRIFDALGQLMYETQADDASQVSTLRISVVTWPQGVYNVQLQTEGKTLTRQVAVQR